MDAEKLRMIRSVVLTGQLPEGLSSEEVDEYGEIVVADYDRMAATWGPEDARRRLRYQLLALKRAADEVTGPRLRILIRIAEDEGLI